VFKWLVILLVVLSAFLVILLGLGYLLKEHEIETTALVEKIAKEEQLLAQKKAKQHIEKQSIKHDTDNAGVFVIISDHEIALDQLPQYIESRKNENVLLSAWQQKQNIIRQNLICQSELQCSLIDIQPRGSSCIVAINQIGALMLAKVKAKENTTEHSCTYHPKNSQAVCLNNLCMIKPFNG